MTGQPETEIPLRVKIVNGRHVPEFPGECEPHTDSPDGYLQWGRMGGGDGPDARSAAVQILRPLGSLGAESREPLGGGPGREGRAVNEDAHGITPPDVTAMSIDRRDGLWQVIIEQGNGDVIKEIELTELERLQLAAMLGLEPGRPSHEHVEFVDVTRQPTRLGG